MKKTFAVLLSAAMVILGLSGCGGGEPAGSTAGESPSVPETETASVSEAAAAGAEAAEPDDAGESPDRVEALPGSEWEFDTPENHGMDGQLLSAMHTALAGTEIYSAVTVKDGVIVDEFYQDGYDETSVFRFNSCSKSFTSALIGIAIDEGLIAGVDVPISEYFPQVIGTSKESITIRHLLEHTSGIEWYEFSSATSFWEMNNADNWVDYVLGRPMNADPGALFTYTTGGTHLLGAILEQVTGEGLLEYAQRHLFTPLAIDSVHWREDPQGIPDAGNGVEMTARDAAKFGQLFLDGGSWSGSQLVPEAWVAQSTGVQVARDGDYGSYGYQWWIRRFAGYDTFYAMGAMGQFILVVPELDLVAVFNSSMSGDTTGPYQYISNFVLAACNQGT